MRFLSLLSIVLLSICSASAAIVRGTVTDKESGEPLIGASVIIKGTNSGAATDIDGHYELSLRKGSYSIIVSYVGCKEATKDVNVGNDDITLDFLLEPDNQMLGEVSVTAVARKNTEVAQITQQRASLVVQTGISAVQIARTQDKDASEVIRRVPGVSIIDDKFVIVRGLSQRYNNVWLNGGAVPSSEADSRAFSFDILPSSQLDNMTIIKSPAPEYPADFTGGFIVINTKENPAESQLNIGIGLGYNPQTNFRSFLQAKGSATDWLGFDNGFRTLDAGMKNQLTQYTGGQDNRIDLLNNGLNNDWTLKNRHPWEDLKLNISYNHAWRFDNGQQLGLLAAANYSNTYKTYRDMENSLYGPYDISNDKQIFLRKSTDNQYNNDTRVGALLNLFFRPSNSNHYFEWKNIFNQLGKDRYTERVGFNAQPDAINDMEYYYSSRTTYNTQFTGKHTLGSNFFDWSVGYAFANRDMPDRRLIQRTDRTEQRMSIYRISREFTKLNEHIASLAANYRKDFNFGTISPVLKTGIYGEYRTRTYRTRQFQYGWDPTNSLPKNFEFDDNVQGNLLIDSNYGPDKIYLYEEVNWLNNYDATQTQGAAYVGINLPWNKWNLYAGLRYEYMRQQLKNNSRQYQESWHTTNYDYNDLFPSANATYKFNDKHQIRAAYGRSVNRPEFRELTPSVFYDFDLGSNVMGNYELKAAYIDNLDLRYEWYPSTGESLSFAVFYKHFKNPIEWTYTVTGGTDLVYSFINAQGANNYGIELDIRKNLDFIGLNDFSFSFNGALIKSKVTFPEGSSNIDRPMQGQSPYLINTGIFYHNAQYGWNAAVLYNRIGKRIIGVGNRYGTGADGVSRNIPDSYEMPRNTIDISLGKKIRHWEIKLSVRDVLAERYYFKQFEDIVQDGKERTIEEVTRSFKPGQNFNLAVTYNF